MAARGDYDPIAMAKPSLPRAPRRRLPYGIWGQLFGVLWCVPILIILVMNFREVSLGATLTCHGCTTFKRAFLLDPVEASRGDRNVIGALQIVSKLLELWFLFVAGKLVYDLCFHAAAVRQNLPFGWVTAPVSFADPTWFLKPPFWASVSSRPRASLPDARLKSFAMLLIILGILVNLMGPATAVLTIPQLQPAIRRYGRGPTYTGDGFSYMPAGLSIPACSGDDLPDRRWDCTGRVYSSSLDALIATREFNDQGGTGLSLPTVAPDRRGQFAFNNSAEGFLWAASRHGLLVMSQLVNATLYGETADIMDAQQIEAHSLNPTYGINSRCKVGAVREYALDDNRSIRCYADFGRRTNPTYEDTRSPPLLNVTNSDNSNVTICLPTGTGNWEFKTSNTSFGLASDDLGVDAQVWTTERGFSFDGDRQDLLDCPLETLRTGDWSQLSSCLTNGGITELGSFGIQDYDMPNITGDGNSTRVYCPWTVSTVFAEYVLSVTNPLQMVEIHGLPPDYVPASTAFMQAEYINLAWSVNDGAFVPNRASSQIMRDAIRGMLDPPFSGWLNDSLVLHISRLQQVIFGHAASISDFNSTASTESDPTAELETYGAMPGWYAIQVYQYGLKTRTAILGAIVVIAGMLVVAARLVLFFAISTARMEERDLNDAAFRTHTPSGLLSEENMKMAYKQPVAMDSSEAADAARFRFRSEEAIPLAGKSTALS
ncbi:MAG: hypothetical protein M1817_002519 [Caeruleum heppii]|nr:MAG: hypothetical protein M1817_002519 [Caeruleum heppii]